MKYVLQTICIYAFLPALHCIKVIHKIVELFCSSSEIKNAKFWWIETLANHIVSELGKEYCGKFIIA